MNVSVETMSGLERRLTIALPSEEFESQITARLEDAQGKVQLPGFRPGRVPLKEVRRRYGPAVRAEVAGELMQSSFVDAVTQEELNPAGSPSLEVVKMDPGIDFEFTATFEVFPSVTVGDLSSLDVKHVEASITDADLDKMVEQLRNQRTTFNDVERVAAEGDQVKVDFSGTLDGEPVAGASGEDMEFRIGQGQMIEDFDKGVLGAAPGETVQFDATFPEEYHAEELRGKTVQFQVTLKAVQEPVVPELDEAFYESFGVEEGGEAAFRDEVRQNMEREANSAIKNHEKQQVMDGLAKIHDFLLPHAVVHREIHTLKDQMLSQFQMGPQAQAPELPDELFQDQAEKRVKVGLIINEVISREHLEVDAAQVDARLQELAQSYGEPDQVIAFYRNNPQQMQSIEMGVLEDQVVDHILSVATVTTVDASYDDIVSGVAFADPEAEAADDDPADPPEASTEAPPQAEEK